MKTGLEIHGECPTEFSAVKTAFAENFARRGEVGAAFAAYQDGNKVIDIWAGTRDRHEELPWQQETLVNVFSASKGVVALCALQLYEQGLLDFSAPVADYWPEFKANGKSKVLVKHVLCHRSGLAAIWQDVSDEAVYDWQHMVATLEQETPHWTPGSAQGYQVFTFGWLVGELIRRITGLSVGTYIQQHIAGPLGLDFYIGLPEALLPRVADVAPRPPKEKQEPSPQIPVAEQKPLDVSLAAEAHRKNKKKPDSLMVRALTTPEALFRGTNSSAWRMAEVPAGNGHSDARSLARMYGALANAGQIDGVRLLQESSLLLCNKKYSEEMDLVLGMNMRFGPGFMQHSEPGFAFGGNRSFGHFGNGGSLAFADPDARLGVSYVTNRLANGDRRNRKLVEALYQSLAL